MTPRAFTELFRPFVRVLLDWARVEQSDWPVLTSVVTSPDELHEWYFPWYTSEERPGAAVHDTDAEPLAVLNWRPNGSDHRLSVEHELAALSALEPPVQFLFPTYGLPQAGRLVLDGNHRLAAAIQGNIPFVACVVTLHGPIDATVLPDLLHWQSAG